MGNTELSNSVAYKEIEKMTKEELEKENTQLKAVWDSFIKKEEDWDKERHAWMQERFDFKNKITGLEMLIEKMKNFIFGELPLCYYCPLNETCIKEEGICPYAQISEEEQKKMLMDWLDK